MGFIFIDNLRAQVLGPEHILSCISSVHGGILIRYSTPGTLTCALNVRYMFDALGGCDR